MGFEITFKELVNEIVRSEKDKVKVGGVGIVEMEV